mgnify:FL=1
MAASSAPVLAAPAPPNTIAPATDTPPVTIDSSTLGAPTPLAVQYASLSEAMLSFSANAQNMTLPSFLASDMAGATALVDQVGTLDLSGVSSQTGLRDALSTQGMTLNVQGVGTFADLYAEFSAKTFTFDGSVALQSAGYVNEMSALRVPELVMPTGLGPLGSLPVEGLAFGLFVNQSLTNMISDSPDLFAQVQATGLNSDAQLNAFRRSMVSAGTTVGSDLSRLPMPCLAEMMTAMGSGSSSVTTPGCGGCASTGAYLHQQAMTLLDPHVNVIGDASVQLPDAGLPVEVDHLRNGAGKGYYWEQNDNLVDKMNAVAVPVIVGQNCGAGAEYAPHTIAKTLPGVFGNLHGPPAPLGLEGGSLVWLGTKAPRKFANSDVRQDLYDQSIAEQAVEVAAEVAAVTPQTPTKLPGVFGNLQGPR